MAASARADRPAHTPPPEGRRLLATERRCAHLSDQDILHIYRNTTPSTRGGGKASVKPGSFSSMGKRYGISWADVQQIYRGYAFTWITGANRDRRAHHYAHAKALSMRDRARARLSDSQIRHIRIMARPGPLDLDRAPNTYASLGKKYDLPEKVIRAIKLGAILAEVPNAPDSQPTPGAIGPGDHWM